MARDDLRFNPDEVTRFFGLTAKLTPEAIAILEARTEGWVAGLKLAALSLKDRPDATAFVQSFAGRRRYVLDYLAEDVLRQLPEPLQGFLLKCAVLERLSASLCNAVTERSDAQALLTRLERANLFLIPLDDRGHWYRFHHRFAEFLRGQAHGFMVEAVNHALKAKAFERAADFLETYTKRGTVRSEVATVLAWLDALPPSLVRARPLLGLAYAWALSASGRHGEVEPHLQRLEALFTSPNEGAALEPLRGHVAAVRAIVDCFQGKPTSSIDHSRKALKRLAGVTWSLGA